MLKTSYGLRQIWPVRVYQDGDAAGGQVRCKFMVGGAGRVGSSARESRIPIPKEPGCQENGCRSLTCHSQPRRARGSSVALFHVDDLFLARGASFITTVDFPDQRKSSSSPSPPFSSSSPSPTPTLRPTYSPTKSAIAIQPAPGYPNPGPSLDSPPSSDTITFALKSIELGDLGFGRGIHGDALKSGCSSNGFVGSSLMGLYSRCGFVKDAAEVLDETEKKTVRS
ncbi:hypothetical protein ACFX2A_046514 [Malus domestica]